MRDLAILGAGAAGMLAALCAAHRGLAVSLIDPHWHVPSNLSISGGLVPMAGSRLQRQAGVDDSPAQWLADLRAFAGESVNERIAVSVATALPQVLDFLLDKFNAPLQFLPDVPSSGHSLPRFHAVSPASGRALNDWLRRTVEQHPQIDRLKFSACVMPMADGFEISTGTTRFAARYLLLAAGGFGASSNMVSEFIPSMAGALHTGSPTNDGSGIALARTWGAALGGMDGYQGQGHTNPGGRTRLGMSIPVLGGIMVNRAGQRFVRENIGPSALASRVLAQPGQQALEVFDENIEARLGNHSAYADAKAAGAVMQAPDVPTLAGLAGIDANALRESLASTSLKPPFRASWVTGSLAHTQGGIATDGNARVLDETGAPIPRLYAAGGCAAGLSGHGGDGYLPGNGLAQSFGLAWLCVADICAERV
jgi:fumarate reductase flavoprotein subunit